MELERIERMLDRFEDRILEKLEHNLDIVRAKLDAVLQKIEELHEKDVLQHKADLKELLNGLGELKDILKDAEEMGKLLQKCHEQKIEKLEEEAYELAKYKAAEEARLKRRDFFAKLLIGILSGGSVLIWLLDKILEGLMR